MYLRTRFCVTVNLGQVIIFSSLSPYNRNVLVEKFLEKIMGNNLDFQIIMWDLERRF